MSTIVVNQATAQIDACSLACQRSSFGSSRLPFLSIFPFDPASQGAMNNARGAMNNAQGDKDVPRAMDVLRTTDLPRAIDLPQAVDVPRAMDVPPAVGVPQYQPCVGLQSSGSISWDGGQGQWSTSMDGILTGPAHHPSPHSCHW